MKPLTDAMKGLPASGRNCIPAGCPVPKNRKRSAKRTGTRNQQRLRPIRPDLQPGAVRHSSGQPAGRQGGDPTRPE